MFSTLQILMILFALFALSRALLRIKDNEITVGEFFFWAMIWVGVILISLIPEIIVQLSSVFGIGRGVDLLIYAGLAFLFYLVFRIFVQMEKLQQEITKLTRAIALNKKK